MKLKYTDAEEVAYLPEGPKKLTGPALRIYKAGVLQGHISAINGNKGKTAPGKPEGWTWEQFQAGFINNKETTAINMKNPNCDGDRCTRAIGEVRLLPVGGRGNVILCRACYMHEIKFRRDMNRDRPALYKYELPRWDSLKIYKEE